MLLHPKVKREPYIQEMENLLNITEIEDTIDNFGLNPNSQFSTPFDYFGLDTERILCEDKDYIILLKEVMEYLYNHYNIEARKHLLSFMTRFNKPSSELNDDIESFKLGYHTLQSIYGSDDGAIFKNKVLIAALNNYFRIREINIQIPQTNLFYDNNINQIIENQIRKSSIEYGFLKHTSSMTDDIYYRESEDFLIKENIRISK